MNESMSKNMMLIAKIEAERRKTGARSYGEMVAKNDYSNLCVKPKRRQEKTVECPKCGTLFFKPPNGKKRYCDDCLNKHKREWQSKEYSKTVRCNCVKCGKPLRRINPEGAMCKRCREEG